VHAAERDIFLLDPAALAGDCHLMKTAQKTTGKLDKDMIRTEVLVIGGGMAGMTLGNALAGAGVAAAVIDSSPPEELLDTGYDGRASAIAWGSAQVFKGIGLWPRLESEAGPIRDIRVADGTVAQGPSTLFLHYDHTDIGDDRPGSRRWNGRPAG
jgi:2-octaprenyl-6-methoxyphenol hydroxylase